MGGTLFWFWFVELGSGYLLCMYVYDMDDGG